MALKTFTITKDQIRRGAEEMEKSFSDRLPIARICPAALCFQENGYPNARVITERSVMLEQAQGCVTLNLPKNLTVWILGFDGALDGRSWLEARLAFPEITFELEIPEQV